MSMSNQSDTFSTSGNNVSNDQGGYKGTYSGKRRWSQVPNKFDNKERQTNDYYDGNQGQSQNNFSGNYRKDSFGYSGGGQGGRYGGGGNYNDGQKGSKYDQVYKDTYRRYEKYDNGSQTQSKFADYSKLSYYKDERGSYHQRQDFGNRRGSFNSEYDDYQPSQSPQELYEQDIDSTEKYNKILNNDSLRISFNTELEKFQINSLIRVKMILAEENMNEEYQFEHEDLQKVFKNFGQIQKIIVKEKGECYIQYTDFFSAYAAQKALHNFILSDFNITLEVQLCLENPDEINEEKLVGHFKHDEMKESDFIIEINNKEDEENLDKLCLEYKYTNKFEIDIVDPEYMLKDRVLGASGANLFRLKFLCEKNSTQREMESEGDIIIKLVKNNLVKNENVLLILTNNFSKYDCAIRFAHELLSQIVEEYKKFCIRSNKEFKNDVHIKRIEKFNTDLELMFKDDEIQEKQSQQSQVQIQQLD